MDIVDALGFLGGACFAYAGVPSAVATVRAGRSIGVPSSLAWMIFLGTILIFLYIWIRHGFDWVLFINYSVEAVSWFVILFYHYKDKLEDFLLEYGHHYGDW